MGIPCADVRRVDVLAAVFDTNKDGCINYGEFLFMFVDRRAILRQWQATLSAVAAGAGKPEGVVGR